MISRSADPTLQSPPPHDAKALNAYRLSLEKILRFCTGRSDLPIKSFATLLSLAHNLPIDSPMRRVFQDWGRAGIAVDVSDQFLRGGYPGGGPLKAILDTLDLDEKKLEDAGIDLSLPGNQGFRLWGLESKAWIYPASLSLEDPSSPAGKGRKPKTSSLKKKPGMFASTVPSPGWQVFWDRADLGRGLPTED